MSGTQLTAGNISTFGKTDRRLLPQTEKVRKRNFTTRFTENMRKIHKRVSSINQNFEDSDSDEYAEYSPGPGSYLKASGLDFTAKSDNSPFQYFGSTSPRFLESDMHKFPGPGTYKEKVEIPKKVPNETSVFKNERKIDTIFDRFISSGPGPGKYNDNRTEFLSKKKIKGHKGNNKL